MGQVSRRKNLFLEYNKKDKWLHKEAAPEAIENYVTARLNSFHCVRKTSVGKPSLQSDSFPSFNASQLQYQLLVSRDSTHRTIQKNTQVSKTRRYGLKKKREGGGGQKERGEREMCPYLGLTFATSQLGSWSSSPSLHLFL